MTHAIPADLYGIINIISIELARIPLFLSRFSAIAL